MSMNSLILGVVDFLRAPSTGLGLDDKSCDEQPDGQPPPMAGEWYVAVTEGSWTNDATECLDESYGVEITITRRTTFSPSDRVNVAVKRELRRKAAEIRAAIHGREEPRIAANTRLDANVENVFVEPLRFRSAGKIEPKGPDWFWAEGMTNPPTGVAITLIFGGARRVQTIESQT